MRLSELLGAQAVDQGGHRLGEVHDVRLREEGGEQGAGPRYVVDGVVTGVGALGARLGYVHGEVAGPWVLSWMMGRMAGRYRYVPWAAVASFDGKRLSVDADVDALVHPGQREPDER